MYAHLTPGVYRLPKPSDRGGVALVRTDVAGFAGFAERGPLRVGVDPPANPAELAVKVESWAEFLQVFGGPIAGGYLAYAVRGFFANGGSLCYVVRVAATSDPQLPANQSPAAASLPLPRTAGRGTPVALAPGKSFGADFQTFTLAEAAGIAVGDLVAIEGDGFRQFSVVVDVSDKTVRIAVPLSVDLTEALAKTVSVVRYAPAVRIRAIAPVVVGRAFADSPGTWGNRIRLDIAPLVPGTDAQEFSLRVSVEPGADTTRTPEEEFYRRVSLDPSSPYFVLTVVTAVSRLIAVTVDDANSDLRLDLSDGPLGNQPARPGVAGGAVAFGQSLSTPLATWGMRSVRLQGGRDGLGAVKTQDFTGGPDDLRGLRLLEEVSEVAILVCPDAAFAPSLSAPLPKPAPPDPCGPSSAPAPAPATSPPVDVPPATDTVTVVRAMLDQCERLRDRVAVVNPPDFLTTSDPNERKNSPARSAYGAFVVPGKSAGVRSVTDWRASFRSAFGALYYPWLKVSDPLGLEGATRRVPPCGHVAGVYAQTDTTYGVQRPPANVALQDVVDVATDVTSTQQELLNPAGVNALRPFAGRGVRVWGARSLEPTDERWKFIHVRRLMSMIEKSVELSSRWAVFEPNDFALRSTLAHSLSVFLEAIWRTGGLDGAVAAKGYYVKCDETNNPPEVVAAGRVVCQVGVATVAPMEFIDFEIHQTADGSQVVEA